MARLNKIRFACFIIVISLSSSASLPFCKECAFFIPGAVAYWPMTNETKGSDLSGNNNHATFVGLVYIDGPTEEYNRAVHFSGNNSFAKVTNSLSMNVGEYPGFSFTGFLRFTDDPKMPVSLIDWSDTRSGMYIVAAPGHKIVLALAHPMKPIVEFPNMTFTSGLWHFFGISYDKATGMVTAFMDGNQVQKQSGTNIVAETAKNYNFVGLGVDPSIPTDSNYNGDMSCMMLFKYALTADDFERVMKFCTSARTLLPNITVSDISSTRATASWTQSPGIFSRYNITIQRNQSGLNLEFVYPPYISASVTSPKSVLAGLVPGATYRVHVLHTQGDLVGGERSSAWFVTEPSLIVESHSISFTTITATSAKVSWKDVAGNNDGYYVDISSTTGGAKADPSTVPSGTTTTSLLNLSPGIYYTITIRTRIGSRTSSPAMYSLYIIDPQKADPPNDSVIGYVVGGICFVGMIIGIVVMAVYFWRKYKGGPSLVVEPDSIKFSDITTTSATIRWKDVTGDYDGYSVAISPTTRRGAKASPETVPRGTTTTLLKNLSPGTNYTIRIITKIGSAKSFIHQAPRLYHSVRYIHSRDLDYRTFDQPTGTPKRFLSFRKKYKEYQRATVTVGSTRGNDSTPPPHVQLASVSFLHSQHLRECLLERV